MKTIHVIAPVVNTHNLVANSTENELFKSLIIPNQIDIKYLFLNAGPSSIEDEIDDALCIPDLMRQATSVAQQGSSGILVDCMCDPGVRVLRTMLNIPVIGSAETAFHTAASLCHKFSVVDIGFDTAPMVEHQIHSFGLSQNFASVRSTGIAVEHIDASENTYKALSQAALAAIRDDGADGIVLGCTGFVGCDTYIHDFLLKEGYNVPVFDPLPLAIRILSSLVLQGLCHSKKAWPNRKAADKQLGSFDKNDPLQLLYPQIKND